MYLEDFDHLPAYVPMPRFILQMDLSMNAKLLYGCLLGRAMLSKANGWKDREGHTYVHYSLAEMAEDLGRSTRTAQAALRELRAAGLAERSRPAYNQSPRLYVKFPEEDQAGPSDRKKAAPPPEESCAPDTQNPAPLPGKILPPNKKEFSKKELRKEKRVEAPAPSGPFGNVLLSPAQRQRLEQDFPHLVEPCVDRLSCYLAQSGRQYRNHEAVVRKWLLEERARSAPPNYDRDYGEGDCL